MPMKLRSGRIVGEVAKKEVVKVHSLALWVVDDSDEERIYCDLPDLISPSDDDFGDLPDLIEVDE